MNTFISPQGQKDRQRGYNNKDRQKSKQSQPAKARRPDVAFIVETHAEMIVSSPTRHDGDLTMEFDQFSQLYKVVHVTTM